MLDFILYNDSFGTVLSVFFCLNIILTDYTKKNTRAKKSKINEMDFFKNITIDFFLFILFLVFVYISFKIKTAFSIFMLIAFIISFTKIFRNYMKDSLYLDYESKQHYAFGTCFLILLFSAKACDVYITSFSYLPHSIKEILLLIYLIFKIIFVVFFVLINISIVVSNIRLLFGKRLSSLIEKISNINLVYEPKYYKFYFSSYKNTILTKIIDKIIFIITCPIFMIFNIVFALILIIVKNTINMLIKIYKFLLNYDNNRNSIIKNILKISLIISFVLVYICTVYESNIFSNQIKEIYNLIVTVILIPVIYDSIKSKDK